MTAGQKLKSLICVLLGRVLLSRKLCTTTSLAEQVKLPDFIDPIENFTEEDSRSESMAVAGRSPKHPRTESDDNGMDVGILMEKAAEKAVEEAADRFSACMDAKIESIWKEWTNA